MIFTGFDSGFDTVTGESTCYSELQCCAGAFGTTDGDGWAGFAAGRKEREESKVVFGFAGGIWASETS